MVREIPVQKPEESEDFFDGDSELKRLLGLKNLPVSRKGWIKDLEDTSESDLVDLVKKKPSVDGSGTP